MNLRKETSAVVFHHTGGPVSGPGPENPSAGEIRSWHLRQGWSDIGYHHVIRRDGRIEPGRDERLAGAHVLNHNSYTIGVVFSGDFRYYPPSKEQLDSAVKLYHDLTTRWGKLKPERHRDKAATICPGPQFPWAEFKVRLEAKGMFDDVPQNHWARHEIERMAKLGLIAGVGRREFGLGRTVSRETLAVVMSRIIDYIDRKGVQK